MLFQVLGALVLGGLILVPVLIWRLSTGPLPLDFLTPYIQASAQARDGSWRADLDGTQLAKGEGRHMFEVQVRGVRLFQGGDHPVMSIPLVSVSFNMRSLLGGILAPSSIRLQGITIHLVRDEQGRFQWDIPGAVPADPASANPSNDADAVAAMLADGLIGDYDPYKPGRQLRELVVSRAEVTLEDRAANIVMRFPDSNFAVRRTAIGADLVATIAVDGMGPPGTLPASELAPADFGKVGLTGSYRRVDGGWSLGVNFAKIRLAPLARLGGGLAPLAMFDMPFSGVVSAQSAPSGATASFEIAGGAGQFRLLDTAGTQYGLSGLAAKGSFDQALHRLTLAQARTEVVNGPQLGLSGTIDGLGASGAGLTLAFEGTYNGMEFDRLKAFWPPQLAPNPREWILDNLSKGVIKDGAISLRAASKPENPGDIDVQKVTGHFRTDGLTVRYLAPLPPLRDASGLATFDDKSFTIDLNAGQVWGVKVKGGKVLFTELDKDLPQADIEADVTGALPDILRLIDQKPLGYAQAMGIDPNEIGGDAQIRMRLRFPLLKDVRMDDLDVRVHAALTAARVPKVLAGQNLSQGQLTLDVDRKGMDASGTVDLGVIPVQLKWHENFVSSMPVRSRYEVKAAGVDLSKLAVFGLDDVPFVAPWMDGALGLKVVAVVNQQGRTDVDIAADLSKARMSLPGMGWKKEERTTGDAKVRLVVDHGKLTQVPHFELVAGDLQADGSLDLKGGGHVERVLLRHLSYGRTAVTGTVEIKPDGGLKMSFVGPSFDAEPLISTSETGDGDTVKPLKDGAPVSTVDGNFRHVWLSKAGGIDNATAHLRTDLGEWRAVSVKAEVGPDHRPVTFDVAPNGRASRVLTITSDDAGSLLRAFDVYDDLDGGSLNVSGAFADDRPHTPLSGVIKIEDFNVVHAPALAQLLTVAALTGVVDVLQGNGIAFSSLEAPFDLTSGRLHVHDARTAGTALGLTANGDIDMNRGRLQLEGTLVPFYSINGALNDVPILGWLTTGAQKGSGLVAFNFSMSGPTDQPRVTLNPLSALTPGFLRHFFDLFTAHQPGLGQPGLESKELSPAQP